MLAADEMAATGKLAAVRSEAIEHYWCEGWFRLFDGVAVVELILTSGSYWFQLLLRVW